MKIINQLQPTRDYIDAILAIANQCLNDTDMMVNPPGWAVAMELLSSKALDALETLHETLTLEEQERINIQHT